MAASACTECSRWGLVTRSNASRWRIVLPPTIDKGWHHRNGAINNLLMISSQIGFKKPGNFSLHVFFFWLFNRRDADSVLIAHLLGILCCSPLFIVYESYICFIWTTFWVQDKAGYFIKIEKSKLKKRIWLSQHLSQLEHRTDCLLLKKNEVPLESRICF